MTDSRNRARARWALLGSILITPFLVAGLSSCAAVQAGIEGEPYIPGSSSEQDGETPEYADPLSIMISGPSSAGVFLQKLPDSREVVCVWARSGHSGGVSCDWESASVPAAADSAE